MKSEKTYHQDSISHADEGKPKNLFSILGVAFDITLDFLFPKPSELARLERMGSEEFLAQVPKSDLRSGNLHTVFAYRHPLVRTAIWELKYWHNENIAQMLALQLHEYLIDTLAEEALFKNFVSPCIVPIPSSKSRLRERGYNQCEFLADMLKQIDNGKNFEVALALKKIKETKPQTEIRQKEKRRQNVRGCFVADPAVVSGRNIIVLDDVITTGSTVREACRAFREAGAEKIIGVALAH